MFDASLLPWDILKYPLFSCFDIFQLPEQPFGELYSASPNRFETIDRISLHATGGVNVISISPLPEALAAMRAIPYGWAHEVIYIMSLLAAFWKTSLHFMPGHVRDFWVL